MANANFPSHTVDYKLQVGSNLKKKMLK